MCQFPSVKDVNTLSNYRDVATKHTQLQLSIDFDKKIVTGTTTVRLTPLRYEGLDIVILDTSGLDILRVEISGSPVQWQLEEQKDHNGQALLIPLDRTYLDNEEFQLLV